MPKSKGPSNLMEAGFESILWERHTYRATIALLRGELHWLDPVIGDAECEQRTPIVLACYELVRAAQDRDPQSILNRLDLLEAYEKAHAKDKPDGKVRTADDARGAEPSEEFRQLIEEVEEIITPFRMDFITFCYSFTVQNVMARAECGTATSTRSMTTFAYEEEGIQAKSTADLKQTEAYHRSAFKKLCDQLFMEQFLEVCGMKSATDPMPENLAPHARQLLTVYSQLQAKIRYNVKEPYVDYPLKDHEIHDHPLQPIFNVILATGFMDHVRKRNFIFHMTREKLTPTGATIPPGTIFLKDPNCYRHISKTTVDVFYRFDATKNGWIGQVGFTPDQLDPDGRPIVANVYEGYSRYVAGTGGSGLDAEDDDEYAAALAACDPYWINVQFGRGHPKYSKNNTDPPMDDRPFHEAACPPPDLNFQFSRERCEGFTTDPFATQKVPSVLEIYDASYVPADERGITGYCRYMYDEDKDGIWLRGYPVDHQINHIYAASTIFVNNETQRLNALNKRAFENGAVIGQYAIRAGGSYYSF